MKTKILDPDALRALSPSAIRSYALFEGWKALGSYGENSEVYNRGEDESAEIIIPITDKIADYPSVVSDLISRFGRELGLDESRPYTFG